MTLEQENPTLGLGDWLLRIRRHRLLLAISIFACWAVGTTVGILLPAKYRSETVILIEQQRVPEHYVEPNIASDLQARLQSMSEQILSRTRLMGIIDKFGLYRKGNRKVDPDATVDLMRKDIGIDLVKSDSRDVSAFKVSYSSNSPVTAQQVTAELTSLFIEENLRNRTQLSENTTAFLETQLEAARKNLDQQEQRLREFKMKYLGQLPEQTASNVQILSGLQGRLQGATDALHQSEQQRLYLQSLMSEYRSLRPAAKSDGGSVLPTSTQLDQQLDTLRAKLADLSAKYTDRHPDVVRMKQEIAATTRLRDEALERQKLQAKSASQQPDDDKLQPDTDNTAVMQVASQLKANELDITNRKTEIKRLEASIEGYQERLNLSPAREQEMAALTRDHEQSRTYYESLLAKRNQSEMATDLERRQQGEQFRMIDPPSLPEKPYSPNRLMFCFAGLAGGIALAAGLLLVLEFANPHLYSEEEVKTLAAMQVLVSVPPLPTPAEKRKRRAFGVLEAVVLSMLALVIPVVTLLIYRRAS
jgi:polysaccharide biosynthesis transport protein